jgi:ferredoxin--NADP+ reductase
VVEGDRLVGLRFRRTKMEGGKLTTTDETFERRGPYVISSIGSIPEPIPAIPMKGELFAFTDWDVGKLDGFPSVFSVGNVVTGKGNIVASRKHAAYVSESAIEHFLGVAASGGHAGEEALLDAPRAEAAAQAEVVAAKIEAQPLLPAEQAGALLERVRARQREVGYGGDYRAWIEKVTPPDLE